MKKLLLTLVFLCTFTFGLVSVSAEEVDLNDVDTNTYIIGNRIYELNSYNLTIYDIVSAAAEYAVDNNGKMAPIYYLGELGEDLYLVEILGVADENGSVPTKFIEDIETVYPDSVMDATSINNSPLYDYIKLDIEPQIKKAVEDLNKEAADNGFESITYKDKTVTFTIADLNKKLADYQNSGIVDIFMSIMGDANSAKYTIGTKTVEKDLTEMNFDTLVGYAYEVLALLAGDTDVLNYNSVANKEVSATVKFIYDGYEYEETYTVKFVYDTEKVMDEKLETAANELNETAEDYGFELITYKDKTATFMIADLTKKLADYKDSGIVEMFLKMIDGATKVSYKVGEVSKEKSLTNLNYDTVVGYAYELLALMAGDAEELNYAAVANKSVEAKVTYLIGGKEEVITYTLSFIYDIEKLMDERLQKAASKLNEKAEDYGFESITYKDKTATFTIAELNKKLADYKDSGIVELFLKMIDGATKVSYKVGEVSKEKSLTNLNYDTVVGYAYELLALLAGDAEELNYNSVANKSVEAKVTYLIGGEEEVITYTLSFIYDTEEVMDEKLEEAANELNETADDYGFESITYEDRTATFTIADPTKKLADYKDSGIVELFLKMIDGATKVSYKVGEVSKEKSLTNLNYDTVVGYAYELLALMAGDAEELNYAAVANKSVEAKVTYVIGGKEEVVTYTLSFVTSE